MIELLKYVILYGVVGIYTLSGLYLAFGFIVIILHFLFGHRDKEE